MLAEILIIVVVAIVVGYVIRLIRRLVFARRSEWIEITDAEGERHRIPTPPRSVPGENAKQSNVRFTTAKIDELKDYFHRSLPDAGWAFVDISLVSSSNSLIFRRGNKLLNILIESDLDILAGKPLRDKMTYTIAVNVKPSRLEEDLAAIKNLGKAGNKDVVESLLAFLDDQRPRIRREAAAAFITIKDERSLRPLINKLTDDDTGVRQHAAVALGELGSQEAVEPLIAGLNTDDLDFQASCAYALGEIKDKRAVKRLISALESNYPRLIVHTAIALGEIGDRSAVEPLIACLKDTNNDAKTKAMAYMSLKKLLSPLEFSVMLESLPVQSSQDSFEAHLKRAVAENVAELATEIIFDFLGIEH